MQYFPVDSSFPRALLGEREKGGGERESVCV